MKVRNTVIGSIFIVVIFTAAFVWFGLFNVAADKKHWQITEWFLEVVRDRSIESELSDISVPANLDDVGFYVKAAGNYAEMCSTCHLAPGITSSEMNSGLYPQPPDFTQHTMENAARSFWIIKHGLMMTGMPAWGSHHSDEEMWQLVAFIRQIPKLDSKQYKELVAQNSNSHTHTDGEHGDSNADQGHHATPKKPTGHEGHNHAH